MAKNHISQQDTDPANNTDLGGINIAQNAMLMSSINDAFREQSAQSADFYDDLGGTGTVAGTADAITLTSAMPALATGNIINFFAGADNTGAATINVNGLGAKAIRKISSGSDVDVAAGDILNAGFYQLVYDAAANSAAGAWILTNPTAVGGGGVLSNIVEDTTPQLGGDLDLNGHGIAFPGATVTDVTGADTTAVSGTAGTDGNLAQWNADGDLVDGPTPFVPNILINGEFRFSQRMGSSAHTSASLFPNDDDTYCLDRWLLLSDGNDIVDVSRETTTVPANSSASVMLDVETANKKAGLLQIVENKDTVPLVSKNLSLSFQARAGGSNATVDKLRAAIVEWTSTADTVTSDIVSAWGAEGADPTLATNWAYISTPADLSLTTSFQEFTVEAASVGSSATNIGVFIWIDNDDGTVADEVYIGAVNLVQGDKALPYRAMPFNLEYALCARFFEKSWRLDTACGSVANEGAYTMFMASTASSRITLPFVAQKRIVPTMTLYDCNGNAGKARVDAANNITVNSGGLAAAEKTFNFDANLATAGVKVMFQYYATAEL